MTNVNENMELFTEKVNEMVEEFKNDEIIKELKNSNEELAEYLEILKNSNEKLVEFLKTNENMEIWKNSNEEKIKMVMNIFSKCSKGNIPSLNENEKMFLKKENEEDENDDDEVKELKKVNRYIFEKLGIYD